MKDISQEEFEKYIEMVANGSISRKALAKELETDLRTLKNKIQSMSESNPELYQRYIQKYPYKTKRREDIDAVLLATEMLKEEKTIQELVIIHNTGRKTIQRRINTLKDSENAIERELYQLCREAAELNSKAAQRPPELTERIERVLEQADMTDTRTIKDKEENVEARRKELLEIERQYNELCKTMPKLQAAQTLGYTRESMFKLLNELYSIEIEKNTKEREFRQGLQVEHKPVEKRTSKEKAPKEEQERE